MNAANIESADAFDAIERYFEQGWTDGLPIVPPRPEVVQQFIGTTGREPEEVLLTFAETNMQLTVENAAINAVMAGCKPEYFPVVMAAIDGWADPRWGATDFYLGNASTGGAGQMVIVNGPIRRELGFNSGIGVFGPGWRPNATVGRAVRLILMNALGMQPGVFDMAIQGHPGKYAYCIAEDEEASPWEPLHVEQGLQPDQSAVSVIGCRGPIPVDERSHQDAEGILDEIAATLPYARGTGVYVLVMGTEHARFIGGKSGWSKRQVKEYLAGKLKAAQPNARRPVSPDSFVIVVAGGGNGGLTSICPSWVARQAITKPIRRL